MTPSPRARTRDLLRDLSARMRAHKPPVLFAIATLHALRDFGARCYELGRRDVHEATTVPMPNAADEDTGRYSITHPHHTEENSDD
jgi:hypothetical protein